QRPARGRRPLRGHAHRGVEADQHAAVAREERVAPPFRRTVGIALRRGAGTLEMAYPTEFSPNMWTVLGPAERTCDGLSRRNFLKVGALLGGGLTLPRLLRATESNKPPRSAILVYLAGGPSHFETFDPKPD